MMRIARSGFTLVEVLVALMLSALVLALGQRILAQLIDAEEALGRSVQESAVSTYGLSEARRLVSLAIRPSADARPFVGAVEVAEFDSLCETGRGGLRHCRVTLRTGPGYITLDAAGIRSVLMSPDGGTGRFQYQQRTPSGVSWADTWGHSRVLPSAVRVVSPRDTLDFPMAVDR